MTLIMESWGHFGVEVDLTPVVDFPKIGIPDFEPWGVWWGQLVIWIGVLDWWLGLVVWIGGLAWWLGLVWCLVVSNLPPTKARGLVPTANPNQPRVAQKHQ